MRVFHIATLTLTLVGPLTLTSAPTWAQSDVLGQVQHLFNNNNNQSNQQAYEQGREDEARRQQAERDRQRAEHDQPYANNTYDRNRDSRDDDRRYGNGYPNTGPHDSDNGDYPR